SAPNLKGRPRKKKLSISQRRDTQGQAPGQGSSGSTQGSAAVAKDKEERSEKKEERKDEETSEESRAEEQAFLVELYKYMKERDTPIERIPFLGFKQINLWTMFQAAQKLGGYELITVRRQWKHVYDELGGNPSSTSASWSYNTFHTCEQDKPLPLAKPRKQECSQEKASGPGAKVKVVGAKKLKVPNHPKLGSKKDRGEVKQELTQVNEPIVIEEEELHVTLKKEESLAVEQPSSLCLKESDCRPPHGGFSLHTGPSAQPEWRQISEALQAKLAGEQQTEGHFIPKTSYLLPRWDQTKAAGHVALPEHFSKVKDCIENHGGRTAVYCKANQGVMSPLAKKKLLSQVCESNPYSFSSLQSPPPAAVSSLHRGDREKEKRKSEEELLGQRYQGASDSIPEVSPIFRPSVIQHAQSSKAHQHTSGGQSERIAAAELSDSYSRTSHQIQPQASVPWQPYLTRTQTQDCAETAGEKILQGPVTQCRSYTGDCYSSPHLHSLYRQTESCLSQERMAGFPGGERREHYSREREGGQSFVCAGLEQEGLVYRSHYGDRTQTQGENGEADDEPRDFSISKPLSQRVSSFSKPSFCSLSYPIMHHGLDSHPKACRVSPMTISTPKQSSPDTSQSFPSPKASGELSLNSPIRPSKRSLLEVDSEDAPERKVRVVTPIHPASAVRRSDPEELKPAEPAHAIHLNNHLPEGHSANAFPPPHTTPLYAGIYPHGTLVSPGAQDGLQQHPGLQYLKSQSAVSPLMPPFTIHSMMLHRQLLASSPSPHHLYRYPGGAALYGELLHHLYPLSTLPPPQLSSVHPSTRL
uniref:AT-rich interaction domain 5B n=1 Tax=Poecilia reticulata TaxID=8081 RepID=A0A3P9NQZ0_POERE